MANQENTAAEPKKKNLLDRVIDLISSVFLPFITLMVAAGILKGIVALLIAANVIVEGDPLYSVFYAMGDAFFYFIPVFLAFTAAKRFGTEPFCAVLVACVLVHPTFVALMEAGEDFSILGLPAKAMTYSSTVIPILLAVYMLKWVESRVPDMKDTPYMIAYTASKQRRDELVKLCKKEFGHPPMCTFQLGCAVSANTGPDAVAVIFEGKPRRLCDYAPPLP